MRKYVLAFLMSLAIAHAATLDYSTLLAGNGEDTARDIFVDGQGFIYVVGGTKSTNFPATIGSCNANHNASGAYMDAFITKWNPSGTLNWSECFGGPNYERAYALEVDASGNVYIGGRAGPNLPTTPGVVHTSFIGDTTWSAAYGQQDAFVAKFNSQGVKQWATYFGSTEGDVARDMTIDNQGNVYLALTGSAANNPDMTPTMPSFQRNHNTGFDGTIVKLNPTATQVLYMSYIGGSGKDGEGPSIRVDSTGAAYITGSMQSADFPTTPGAYQTTYGGGNDIFIMKIAPNGQSIVYSTMFGGNGDDFSETHHLWIDAAGHAYLASGTNSDNIDLTPYNGYQPTKNGLYDGYIIELETDGSKILHATWLGGTMSDFFEGIIIDPQGNILVSGRSNSSNFPVTNDAIQKTKLSAQDTDAFMVKFTPDLKTLLYSSYIGGNAGDEGRGVYYDSQGRVYGSGRTFSTNFPTTANAPYRTAGSPADSFLYRVSFGAQGPVCGNNVIESGETCDGSALAGATCISQGFTGGTLSCYPSGNAQQCQYDTSACTNTVPPKTGDLNNDGHVDITDVMRVVSKLGQQNVSSGEDVNNDGAVDLFDLVTLARNWG